MGLGQRLLLWARSLISPSAQAPEYLSGQDGKLTLICRGQYARSHWCRDSRSRLCGADDRRDHHGRDRGHANGHGRSKSHRPYAGARAPECLKALSSTRVIIF